MAIIRRKPGSNQGFTLPELLIAAAIFAFAMAGVLKLFASCVSLDQSNRNKSIAVAHAESAMEYLKSQSFTTLEGNLCSVGLPQTWTINHNTLNLEGCGLPNEGTINVTTTAQCCGSSPLDLLNITTEVSWRDRVEANERNLQLVTSIAR